VREPMAKKIKVTVFDELRESLQDALAFETNRRRGIHETDLRVTALPPPPRKLRPRDIRAIRRSLNASQVLFARFLNVSPNTIRSWEQGARRPQGADLKLLAIVRTNPHALLRN
jgi:putative transcriptional regulator